MSRKRSLIIAVLVGCGVGPSVADPGDEPPLDAHESREADGDVDGLDGVLWVESDTETSLGEAGGPEDLLDSEERSDSGPDRCVPPAGVGCPCVRNTDCLGGLCVLTDEGRLCSASCHPQDLLCLSSTSEWCAVSGWAVQEVSSSLLESLWVCLPLHPRLCRPCKGDSDCASWTEAVCLDYGPSGRYCGTRCDDTIACPEGYECEEVPGEGALGRACRLVSGECTCSTLSILEGASTACVVLSEFGSCIGERRCTQDGLSPCEAASIAAEVCDQADNDCDGLVDEEWAEGCAFFFKDADRDGFGTGSGRCLCGPTGDFLAKNNADCNDGNPLVHPAAKEICDGVDNNCDGHTDPSGTCPSTPTRKICLDPGHGGSDPGAVGYVVEKEVNLDIVLRFRDLLTKDTANQLGGGSWQVFLTRDSDVTVSLQARVAYANNLEVDRFISTHNNACGYCGGHGTETYWYTEGSAQSKDLATHVQNQVVAHLGTTNRGVKQANFYVLKYTNMPAILLEGAFVDHPGDAAKLADPFLRQEIAMGQFHGLLLHYGYGEFEP